MENKETIFALPMCAKEPNLAAMQSLCFGSCGKISMAGAIDIDPIGPCFVCCEAVCQYSEVETEIIGESALTGDLVRVRIVKDSRGPQS